MTFPSRCSYAFSEYPIAYAIDVKDGSESDIAGISTLLG